MWSVPRTVSTALMRSWGNRSDTVVCDEPLYAHYLAESGVDHPARDRVLASHEKDWRKVAAWLTGPLPDGKKIFYQKHMAHHLTPSVERGWLAELTHAYLIRHPREVLLSYAKVRRYPTISDLGLPQLLELYAKYGGPVVDAADLLRDPEGVLQRLCDALEVPFDQAMLHWPPGPRETDGVWAPYWYSAVNASSGFAPYRPTGERLPAYLEPVLEECLPYYETLHADRLTVSSV